MKEVTQLISNFIADRPTMAADNSSPERMRQLLMDEIEEYFAEEDPKEKAKELSDCLWFLITMAILTGVDLEAEIREKAAYNMIRYQAKYFQTGDYSEARKRVKADEKNLGLKDEFYSI